MPVVLNFAEPFGHAAPGSATIELSTFVAGADDRATLVRSGGRSCCLQFNLTYDGARRLFRQPMAELAGRTKALGDVLGRAASALIEKLGNAPNWRARFDILDRFLEDRLLAAPGLSTNVAQALPWLAAEGARILDIAEHLGITRKRLVADFMRDIGLPPKTVAKLRRFTCAVALLHRRGRLSTIAHDCGN